ncbi:XRE family transcriptional regulator [Serinibacter arcticus]|uniref:XRE family transcriptional regulator n=1 Tax=Serinibacter arcticus TaxID=1655435 RepID=A0A2U1ZZC3_9MICO|nr:helix-turn-helix transcriptional regulator [Serinibacter arcticus]PWD52335.1 XRE family transcriptional regulator [Serinibacter arcticus]
MLPRVRGDLQRRVGRRVHDLRMARGLSQEAFALQLGVHRTHLGSIERGERNLTLQSVEGLAERLGVDVDDLVVEPGDVSD